MVYMETSFTVRPRAAGLDWDAKPLSMMGKETMKRLTMGAGLLVLAMLVLSGCGGTAVETKDDGSVVIAELDDKQCRFLCAGDVNNDGRPDLVAAAMKSGLWIFWQEADGSYRREQIDADSSGYEHTTYITDLDGDGTVEIYVAADDQREVRSYVYQGGSFEKSLVVPIPPDHITWNLTCGAVADPETGTTWPSLLMGQAQFVDDNGSMKPGPAKLVIIQMTDDGWKEVVLEDPVSNVFHKAMIYDFEGEEPGILTIGANQAALKIWRHQDGAWQETLLWNPVFGGKWDRLRDIEIGDVTGDGIDELVIATHDQGVVAVAMRTDEGWDIMEMSRMPSTFVHEVEIGDVDGDGLNEFFTTPSEPNKASGHSQPGHVYMYKWNGTEFVQSVVDDFETSHAKEILAADMNGDGISELFSVMEARTTKEGKKVEIVVPVQIKQYLDLAGTP